MAFDDKYIILGGFTISINRLAFCFRPRFVRGDRADKGEGENPLADSSWSFVDSIPTAE